MSERRLYELINPSDAITFRATVEEAAFIAARMLQGPYFVKDAETGEEPKIDDLGSRYDALWSDAERLASYALAYRSFLVGNPSDRRLFEAAIERMPPDAADEYRREWHAARCTSFNDICAACWETAEKIAAYRPEAAHD
ncbi:hypothetical protein [Ancylobacter mangrovi]|uniref:hypothetical protein n=1 Tax=Ancylobacter mangrovi TaxID=2972472 RepID=UPI0021619DA6|nr:hypothetical protein [Ancylobacter mangrovi]MCS0501574.1 hypothetical protein [Ancylobacter mangrovi]